MSQVAQDPKSQAQIEHFLAYALREWAAVPQYAAEFPTWGDTQQLAFVHEWAIREDALDLLRDYARRRLLTLEQRGRYDRLLQLVAEHRPTIKRLLADD
jgi:hypothetical protein